MPDPPDLKNLPSECPNCKAPLVTCEEKQEGTMGDYGCGAQLLATRATSLPSFLKPCMLATHPEGSA